MSLADVASRVATLQQMLDGSTAPGSPGPGSTPAAGSTAGSATGFAAALSAATAGTGIPTAATAAVPAGSGSAGLTGAAVVADARRYLGVPYQWGGTSPATGFDCSGLVQHVYADLGISLPRVAADQARVGQPVAGLAQAQPGDLVAFGNPVDHIGIYAGNGMMVVAPHTGTVVQLEQVYETPTAIRRIVPAEATAAVGAAGRPAALGVGAYAGLFAAATARFGLPPGLLAAVAQVESGGNPAAVSPAGAEGLMQLMPSTAASLGVNPFDPAAAVDGAARMLAGNLATFGSLPLAVAAYNAGAGAVQRYGGIPPYPETQAYVARVLGLMPGGGA